MILEGVSPAAGMHVYMHENICTGLVLSLRAGGFLL